MGACPTVNDVYQFNLDDMSEIQCKPLKIDRRTAQAMKVVGYDGSILEYIWVLSQLAAKKVCVMAYKPDLREVVGSS